MPHALKRTSAQDDRYEATCVQCGQTGLTIGAVMEKCPADGEVLTPHELIEAQKNRSANTPPRRRP